MDIRRRFTYDYNSNLEDDLCPTNEIWYTSNNNYVITPYKSNVFGATITSNTYSNGKGIIAFDGDVTTIGYMAFYNRTRLTSVTIPDSVTSIGDSAFHNCGRLENVTIPDSVTSIGNSAFMGCSLTSITIPDNVTTIGNHAFGGCNSLTSVTIGNGVTRIEEGAFWGCSSLESVYCKPTTPPALEGTFVFDSNGSSRKIYVPAGSVEAYKSATNWDKYASAIVGYDF